MKSELFLVVLDVSRHPGAKDQPWLERGPEVVVFWCNKKNGLKSVVGYKLIAFCSAKTAF